jgi:pimeloyl-ACP methyl ester carboxylesterase
MLSLRPDRIDRLRILNGDTLLDVAVRVWSVDKPRATLFCLHGFAGTGQDFAFLGRMLRRFQIETIAIDMPGRGASSFLGDPSRYSLRLNQTALADAIKLAQAPLVLAGTSWGGVIAANIALNSNQGVNGLVLVDTPLVSAEVGDHPHEDFIRDEALRQFSTAQSARVYYAATRNLQHLPPHELDEMMTAAIMPLENGFRMRFDPALFSTIGRRSAFNLTPGLAQARFPVLSVLGEHSHLVTSAKQVMARDALPAMKRLYCNFEAHPPSLSRAEHLEPICAFITSFLDPRS